MANFTYKATGANGKLTSGSIEAGDRSAALQMLSKQNLKPISIEQAKPAGLLAKLNSIEISKPKVKNDDLVVFTRQLSTMVSAGVPLLRSLTTLQAQSESKALRGVLGEVVIDVQSGKPLADALAKHPNAFSDIYVNMVRAGEAAGILDDILKRVAAQQEKSSSMKKKVKGAMTYPMVLLAITLLAFFGLMLFVLPQIGEIIKDLGGEDAELPAITAFMLGLSDIFRNYWYIVAALFVGAGYGFKRFVATEHGKMIFHTTVLRIPAVGVIIQKVAVARFARTYASLMSAGVSVLESLKITGRAVGNKAYEKALLDAVDQVRGGSQLSKSLEGNTLFPGIVPQMLAVGEETGQTDTVLAKVADFYEEEVDQSISNISSIIEPVMIVIMGGMVGVIAASALMPIFNLSSTIG